MRSAPVLTIAALLLYWPGMASGASEAFIAHGPTDMKLVALTFDDGPSLYTRKILALLNRYQARATFFVLGCHAARYPCLIRALQRAGHEVENHSFSHIRFPQANCCTWAQQLMRTEAELACLGVRCHRLFRPPYSDYNEKLLTFLGHIREQAVLWSVDSGDWRGLSEVEIAVNVLRRVHNGAIIVFHDSDENGQADRSNTVKALEIILPILKARGYKFVTVEELLNSSQPPKAGGLTGH
jgi:peptidoglycan/xylan/chitin deacetylase (PgdA/CDA1 family)|uniref:Polysaccharide deacetylase family protein n=1 Tax=Desulfobacca acetoxidans TaxID=60893 RepID=A0A7C3WTA8_9BACT